MPRVVENGIKGLVICDHHEQFAVEKDMEFSTREIRSSLWE